MTVKEFQSQPEQRALNSLRAQQSWKDPDIRRKRIEAGKRAWSNPKARTRMSALMTERAKDPVFRAKLRENSLKRGRKPSSLGL